MVEHGAGPAHKVEYAADMRVDKYGSGFGRPRQPIVDPRQTEYLHHPWNLNNIPSGRNSLMQFPRSQDISGINIPWLYVGMRYSTFCWHYEDLMLSSMNYAHYGEAKMWYAVPEADREKFERAVKAKVA
jgi:histone demethylase JARID1